MASSTPHGVRGSAGAAFCTSLAIACLLAAVSARATVMEWYNVPILINSFKDDGVSEAEAKAMLTRTNEIYKQAKIKFTLKKVNDDLANPGDGNESWTRAERDKVREDGKKELEKVAGKDKGVKVSFAKQPDSSDAKTLGLAIKGHPVAIAGETAGNAADSADTFAHELGHVLGLDDRYADADKDKLMYGYSETDGKKLGAGGQKLTPGEIAIVAANAKKLGKVEKVEAAMKDPTERQPKKSGVGTSSSAVTPRTAEQITYATFSGDSFSSGLELSLMLGGIAQSTDPVFDYSVLFDADDNPLTGAMVGAHAGIDNVLQMQLDPASETVSASLLDDSFAVIAGAVGSSAFRREVEFENLKDVLSPPIIPTFDPGRDFIDIELVALNLVSSAPITVVSGNPGSPFDEFSVDYTDDLLAGFEGPQLLSSFFLFDPSAPIIDFEGFDYLPNEMVDLFLDDTLLATVTADVSGQIAGPLALPSGLARDDFFFITGQGRDSGDFGFFVVMSKVPEPGSMALVLAALALWPWRRGRQRARRA